MFLSFFPKPKWFFLSALLWCGLAIAAWYFGGRDLGAIFGMAPLDDPEQAPVGVQVFWSPPFLWFYLFFIAWLAPFAAFWMLWSKHPWSRWSVLGSALILFATSFQVEVSVAINHWRRPFFDMMQAGLSKSRIVEPSEWWIGLGQFTGIALLAVVVSVVIAFFVSHYLFRWRTAMNQYYMAHWMQLRTIEGAAQRVQEDTKSFASITEDLGVSAIQSVLTLIAFLPILVSLGKQVPELALLGSLPNGLVWAAILWSVFGTVLLAVVGIKLPGLQFNNQRVEAAFRKELVYGEDDASRAQPATVAQLFSNLRHNYFRMFFHYTYFNMARSGYLQADSIIGYILLAPSIVVGAVTLGIVQQVLGVFSEVRSSFQYLVLSWGSIIDLISIYKRLRGFDAILGVPPLADTPQPPPEVDSSKPAQEAGLA